MGTTPKNVRCKRDGVAVKYGYYCWQHRDQRFRGVHLRVTNEQKRDRKYQFFENAAERRKKYHYGQAEIKHKDTGSMQLVKG